MKMIDILVAYQESGLTGELVIEIPAGLSNTEFVNFIHASIGEKANIINVINLDLVNRQKPEPTVEAKKAVTGRPERRSDSRPRFGGGESRPYKGSAEKPTGGYAGRSPRDGARPPRAGFGSRPSRGDSRDSKRNGFSEGQSRSKKAPSRGR